MKLMGLIILLFLIRCAHSPLANSTDIKKFLAIPVKTGEINFEINALFLSRSDFSKPPLIVLSHGTPFNMADAPEIKIENMSAQANEFIKLGFAVLIVERRGFGKSKEKLVEFAGDCEHHDQISSGKEAAKDILGAIDYAQAHLEIDPAKIILVGHSAGGFVTVFATGYQHAGIQAAINIEGGRGFDGQKVCSKNSLLKAYSFAGRTSRIPTLWIYTENDHVFSKSLAPLMLKAFTSKGGRAEFRMLPPFQNEGHALFSSPAGIQVWQPLVKNFLNNLQAAKN